MYAIITYLTEVSICTALLYLPFAIRLKKETFFKWNRGYLLSSMAISFIVPLIHIQVKAGNAINKFYYIMEPLTVTTNSNPDFGTISWNSFFTLPVLYISGTFIFLAFFLQKLFHTFSLIRRHSVSEKNGVKLVCIEKEFAPASFFKYVFASAGDEMDEIIEHEKAHIALGHSWDIVFMELATIVLWFNPFVWLYGRSLRSVHEFQADEKTLNKGFDRSAYQHLVFERSFGVRLNGVAAHFNVSPLKERLKMMTKNKSNNRAKWQYTLAIPILLAAFFYVSCENLSDKNTEANVASTEKIYDEVDIMAEYPGGFQNVRKHIAQNIQYPGIAVEQGIEGKIFVRFVVDANGKVTNPKCIRTETIEKNAEKEVVVISYRQEGQIVDNKNANVELLEQEAIRVVNELGDFSPAQKDGHNVSVAFTMPIVFTLQ